MFRTDENNNPTAFTTAVAQQAGLKLGVDYQIGTAFPDEAFIAADAVNYMATAKLLGDPIQITIRVIDALGFVTAAGNWRWSYIVMPKFAWNDLFNAEKRDVIGFMYKREGGTAMVHLFPNYNFS